MSHPDIKRVLLLLTYPVVPPVDCCLDNCWCVNMFMVSRSDSLKHFMSLWKRLNLPGSMSMGDLDVSI